MVTTVLALVLSVAPGCSPDDPATPVLQPGERMPGGMTLSSPAFRPGGTIPERYTCEGENVPPPLRWRGTPEGTTEVAVAVEDPDAPDGTFVNWIVVAIAPATTSIEPDALPPGGRVLPGSSDNPTYIGPCPPDGDEPHRYHFQVYALRSPPPLPEPSSPEEKVRAIRRAAIAGGLLVGTFDR